MQSYLLALGVLAALCLSTFAATFGRNDAEAIGGSSYATGTCGCDGVTTTILTGVGTSWSPSMAGGIINFLPWNALRQVRRVINSTALELDSTIACVGTSLSYTIYYGGIQMSTQTWSSAPTYVGDGQTNTTLLNPSNQLNIVGPASSNTGLNLYINDQYASATLLSYAHDNTHLTFDATFCTSCGSWYSSTANGAQRIHKSSGNLLFEASGPVAAGSSIPSWAVWMNANSAGAVTFPLNSGVKFQTSGGTPTGLNYYEEYSTVLSSTTPCPLSVTAKFTRIGNMITAVIGQPSSACTSTMVNRPYFGSVPSRFSSTLSYFESPVVVITSGVYETGRASVFAGGIYIWAATASGNFPIGATVDWPGITLTYLAS